MRKKFAGFKLALAFGAILSSVASAEIPSGEMLASTCTGCHGTDGVSAGPAIPSIAGISEEYFIEVMEEYASDHYPSTIMGRIARGYTKEENKAMAEVFSKYKMISAVQKLNKDNVEKGKKLHDKFCDKCHEEGGSSAEDDAGILAGQWIPYLRYKMEDYNDNPKLMPKKMRRKVKKLNEAHGEKGMQELYDYYASQ